MRDQHKFNFRKGDLSDLDQLRSLGRESYAEFSKVLTSENWSKMNASIENSEGLTNLIEQSVVYVCEKGSEIIGMIYLIPSGNPTELFHENWCYIRFLGVNTKFRGIGIGKKLTDLCIDYAKGTNESHVALHTAEFMDPARAIYEKAGFIRTKEIEFLGKKYWIYLLDLN